MFIDLDNFKYANDAAGHDAGDLLLKVVAKRLSAVLRNSDTLCRLGGDEFAAILPQLSSASQAVSYTHLDVYKRQAKRPAVSYSKSHSPSSSSLTSM